MGLTTSTRKKSKNNKNFIFRGKSSKSKKRQIIEALVLLVIGLNSKPEISASPVT